jgi:hypothetical protein
MLSLKARLYMPSHSIEVSEYLLPSRTSIDAVIY